MSKLLAILSSIGITHGTGAPFVLTSSPLIFQADEEADDVLAGAVASWKCYSSTPIFCLAVEYREHIKIRRHGFLGTFDNKESMGSEKYMAEREGRKRAVVTDERQTSDS